MSLKQLKDFIEDQTNNLPSYLSMSYVIYLIEISEISNNFLYLLKYTLKENICKK